MTTETTAVVETETPVTKKSHRKAITIGAIVTAFAVIAAVGVPVTMHLVEEQRIANRTAQAEAARADIDEALEDFEAARVEFIDETLIPLFGELAPVEAAEPVEGEAAVEVKDESLLGVFGEFVTISTGRTDLLEGESLTALLGTHADYTAAKPEVFAAYAAEATTPEVVYPTAAEYIDETTVEAAIKRDAATIESIEALITALFSDVEFEYTVAVEGAEDKVVTLFITGASTVFEDLIAELAKAAPAQAETFVGTMTLASQEARDAVVADAKAFEQDATIEKLTTYLASGRAASEAQAAAEAAAAAAAAEAAAKSGGKRPRGSNGGGGGNDGVWTGTSNGDPNASGGGAPVNGPANIVTNSYYVPMSSCANRAFWAERSYTGTWTITIAAPWSYVKNGNTVTVYACF